ncbi:GNAT family N-acetyltransferase [Sanguibacter inulinus]|uniref:GNAT family N-acetyltransferase n=1 Tax=Sanguibacter inulinus TaxID=60922 RepID=UPI001883300B|nr:GNAT family N-acetyltransferase [Sanguibacter inulinus]MBF0721996.1 GNAT family N-acetyltransferase [Sanguibacter inulinus]
MTVQPETTASSTAQPASAQAGLGTPSAPTAAATDTSSASAASAPSTPTVPDSGQASPAAPAAPAVPAAPIASARGTLHHVEIWVPDLEEARATWGWLLTELGYSPFQTWDTGFSLRLGGTYLVFEQSAALSSSEHDRLRPGLNHLALHSGSQARVDRLYAAAQEKGWTPLFADRYPWAGGKPSDGRPGHYAAFLQNSAGFEVELVAAPADVVLRPIISADIDVFFRMEQDREANRIAAFTVKDPTDRGRFDARWKILREDPQVTARTILVGGRVAGSIMTYVEDDEHELTYWIGREYWGRGVATKALRAILTEVTDRPMHARTAKDNVGSLTVLKRCGFEVIGEDSGFANGRGEVVEEFILALRDQPVQHG